MSDDERNTCPRTCSSAAQLAKVIDFAIIRYDEAAIGAQHRLRGGGAEIDDGEPPVTKSQRSLNPRAATVRSAMRDRARHALDHTHCGGASSTFKSNNSAHNDARSLLVRAQTVFAR